MSIRTKLTAEGLTELIVSQPTVSLLDLLRFLISIIPKILKVMNSCLVEFDNLYFVYTTDDDPFREIHYPHNVFVNPFLAILPVSDSYVYRTITAKVF